MKALLRLLLVIIGVFAGGVVYVKYRYEVSWEEALEIVDQLVEDLLA